MRILSVTHSFRLLENGSKLILGEEIAVAQSSPRRRPRSRPRIIGGVEDENEEEDDPGSRLLRREALKGRAGFYFACNGPVLSAAASRLTLGLGAGGRGQKLLPAVVAAKVERLSIALRLKSGGFVHGHSADGVFGR